MLIKQGLTADLAGYLSPLNHVKETETFNNLLPFDQKIQKQVEE